MKLARFAAAIALASTMSSAFAHGQPKAQHGGVVAAANDLFFELVVQGDRTTLYLFDHDKPLDAKGFSGKLTILVGSDKTDAELKPVGENRLDAHLAAPKGSKVVAVLNASGRKPTTVRFTLK